MTYAEQSCRAFVAALASRDPVPGGGGASALVGAVGAALGNMVGSLTLGKKKYAAVQDDIVALKARADALQGELLELIREDALAFEPLARAYGLPKETEAEKAEKDRVMEEALRGACAVPLRIMRAICAAVDLHEAFAEKGTAIAISDVGVGAAFCRAALQGASLNVFINTKAMRDRAHAEAVNREAEAMLETFVRKADAVYDAVRKRLV